eukprot:gene3550-6285_t
MTRIGFDIGGVIVDTSTREPYEGALMSIKLAVEKYGAENIFVVSKAKNFWIKQNLELFEKLNFYEITGMKKENIYFVDEFKDKKEKCLQLGINFMIDDEAKVIRSCLESKVITPIWYERSKEECFDERIVPCKSWTSIRKFLNKTKK